MAVPILALALLVGSCGNDDGGPITTTAAPPTTPPLTSTAPPDTSPLSTAPTTTTTSATPTTATTMPAPVYDVATHGLFPDPFPGSDEAHGSGCVVDGPGLADGVWFGFAEAIGAGSITLDLACFFTGGAAHAAAAADGAEAFDFYVRNLVQGTYTVPVEPSGRAWYLDASGDIANIEVAMTAWPHPVSFLSCPGDYCSVWLFINGGRVTELVEQYLP
jgi:hypothetical protein